MRQFAITIAQNNKFLSGAVLYVTLHGYINNTSTIIAERAKLFAKISARHRVPMTSGEHILHLASSRKTSSCHFPCRISRKQASNLSLAWDSRALSPHMTLAVCTRLPNAYNATPANRAICGKSLLSNLSASLSLSSLFSSRRHCSLPFSVLTIVVPHVHFARYASRLSPSVSLSYSLPISCIQKLYSSLLSLNHSTLIFPHSLFVPHFRKINLHIDTYLPLRVNQQS